MKRPLEVDASAAGALADIHAEAFCKPWPAQEIASLMTGPQALGLADADPPRDAFLLARVMAGEAEILTLAVRPSARRRGLGRALVEAAVERLSGVNVEALWLEVAEDNDPARALYKGCGFQSVGRRAGYYLRGDGTRRDAVVMRRLLNPPA